jgi:hypothetical protein
MAFDFRSFLTALKLFVLKFPTTPIRRILITSAWLVIYPLFILVNRLGLMFDRLFMPEFKAQPLTMPLHLMGNPRSGTTFMFNLFCLDEQNFSYFTFYDILFPSISLRWFLGLFGRLDLALGGWLKKGIVAIDRAVFNGVRDIHPTGLFHPEEDIMLFFHTFLSPFFMLIFPYHEDLPHLATFLDRFPLAERQKYMNFYEECIKAQLYRAGGNKRLLSKNVYYNGSMKTLIEQFPDIKILYILRNPTEAIASFQSMLYAFSRFFAPELPKNSPEMQAGADLGREYYRYGYKLIQELPDKNVMVVTYDQVIREPKLIIEQVYRWMGLEMDPVFLAKLEAKLAQGRKFKSKHVYDPQEFGTSEALIYQEFQDVFEKYGFARHA